MPSATAQRFNELIGPHLDALFRAAFRLVRNRADAQDLVQETCVRAYLRIDELRGSDPVKGWLLRVLHNLFVDGFRRARLEPRAAGADRDDDAAAASSDPDPEQSAYAAQREEQLQRAWLRLDRGQRALLALRAEGYTPAEIGAITALAPDAVHARLYRARRSFARHLAEAEAPAPRTRMEVAK